MKEYHSNINRKDVVKYFLTMNKKLFIRIFIFIIFIVGFLYIYLIFSYGELFIKITLNTILFLLIMGILSLIYYKIISHQKASTVSDLWDEYNPYIIYLSKDEVIIKYNIPYIKKATDPSHGLSLINKIEYENRIPLKIIDNIKLVKDYNGSMDEVIPISNPYVPMNDLLIIELCKPLNFYIWPNRKIVKEKFGNKISIDISKSTRSEFIESILSRQLNAKGKTK